MGANQCSQAMNAVPTTVQEQSATTGVTKLRGLDECPASTPPPTCPFSGKAVAPSSVSKCPFFTQKQSANEATWWPNKLSLKPLGKDTPASVGDEKAYAAMLEHLDEAALKADLVDLMKTSQEWWPADYGHYGPFLIRMAWHSAGSYRSYDGRGGGGKGNLRFAPLNSWPDNQNLDKAKRLLWPLKKKYGAKISWADLMLFAGHVALEDMGLPVFGFAFGRVDLWEPEEDQYWGAETKWLTAERGGLGKELEQPLGAVEMGLIYVNPEGPGGHPDPLLAAQDIRETFGRMAMNDEETVALIAGGHTFGKAHGAADPATYVGAEPEGAPLETQGLGWVSSYGTGAGADTITSGLEGAWTSQPTKWDNGFFANLFKHEWEKTKSPAGATQWIPKGETAEEVDGWRIVPDAHDATKKHLPIMFTTDLALRLDPAYAVISKRFHDDPAAFADSFAKAWYKLTHRDLGPHTRLLGSLVPPPQLWQDPVPPPPRQLIGAVEIAELKASLRALIASGGLSIADLVRTAWASASTYRGTDHRGGANGARIRLAPQKDWEVNEPAKLARVLSTLEDVAAAFNAKGSAPVSMADLIVLGGACAVEAAAAAAGDADVTVAFTPGRTDATAEQTDAASFAVLEPHADGFRNYVGEAPPRSPLALGVSPEALLVDRASLLTLSKAEMAVLVGGLRVLGANVGDSCVGVLTSAPGALTNDFFVNLTDMSHTWAPSATREGLYEAKDRVSGEVRWTASRVDLAFGSNSELRALAEYYACDDAQDAFIADFVRAWTKVMELDRFDVNGPRHIGRTGK